MGARRLLIAYHSQSGSSARLAGHALRGAEAAGEVEARLGRCADLGSTDLSQADALLLVCAENSGRLSGGAKDFLDRIFYPLAGRGLILPYALLISAGNDGRGAVAEAERILGGIPFTAAIEPRIIRGEPGDRECALAAEFAAGFAAGVAMGIF